MSLISNVGLFAYARHGNFLGRKPITQAMYEKQIEWCLLWTGPCLPSSEWASWAQAIFSGAAVLAAIGVVWWQQVIAHRQALAAAQLAASGLLTLMNQTIGGLQSVADGLQERVNGFGNEANSPRHLATIIATLPLPERGDLLALNGALPACSIKLLQASNSVKQVHTALNTIVAVVMPGINEQTLPEFLRPLHELVLAATNAFVEAREHLNQFCLR